MKKLYGVGINDSEDITQRFETVGWRQCGKIIQRRVFCCPFYTCWAAMLRRAYSQEFILKQPAHAGCTVSEDWLTFSNFKRWMETQDYEGKQLDKDLLVMGNKIYSEDTCLFVSGTVNKFITDCAKARGELPVGVSQDNRTGNYRARVNNLGKGRVSLGHFKTPEEAHQAWLKAKLELAKELAAQQDDPRVAEALVKRYENYKEG